MIKKLIKIIYKIVSPIIYKIKYPSCDIENSLIHPSVKLGIEVIIKKGCKIDKDITIDSYTYINEYTRIDSNTSKIGKYCSISHNVKIGMGPHPLNCVSTSPIFYSKNRGYINKDTYNEYEDKGYTEIGHDVLIGSNVIILAGVKIGTGAIIGAGSVVVKHVKPYTIVGGNPSKLIRKRFDNKTIKKLINSKWWEKSPQDLINMDNVERFLNDN
ncbi:MAG: CatB-related O-acetyltransferase [Sulfurovaceae bacterium]|nr:CatB-related O-acetyltransferase [Sulfurovaceae bacterium]